MKKSNAKKSIKELKGKVKDLIIEITINLAHIEYDDEGTIVLSKKERKQVMELEEMRAALMSVDPKQAKKDRKVRDRLPF